MKKFQIKDIKNDMLEGLYSIISDVLDENIPMDDTEALLFTNLRNLQGVIYDKLKPTKWQKKYSFSIPAEQAIALRILQTDYIIPGKNSITIYLLNASNDIHKIFELPEPKTI